MKTNHLVIATVSRPESATINFMNRPMVLSHRAAYVRGLVFSAAYGLVMAGLLAIAIADPKKQEVRGQKSEVRRSSVHHCDDDGGGQP